MDTEEVQGLSKHTHAFASCSSTMSVQSAPSRILNLNNPKQNLTLESIVRLLETDGVATHFTPYVALSYCWGLCKTLVTNKENFDHHKIGVRLSSFAKTHQEAMIVANALGHRYLWIDALCIIQDDLQDWKREASKMGDVYKGADLTIAASTGTDSESGLFITPSLDELGFVFRSATCSLDPSPSTSVCIRKSQRHNDFLKSSGSIDNLDFRSPLMKRGWVFQERLLSPRYLHFGRELVWECAECAECECGILQKARKEHSWRPKGGFQNSLSKMSSRSDVLKLWKQLIEEYSSLALTNHDDQLPAISRLAREFESHGLGSYHTGHWQVGFLESLLWTSSVAKQQPRPQAWSSRS
jgi:hypothetical protein